MKGTFRAKAVIGVDHEGKPISGLRTSKKAGTPEFFILFEITEAGESKGKRVPWDGWLTESTEARTIEALLLCGLEGDDLSNPVGINKNEVLIVVDEEEYKQDVEKTDETTGATIIVQETRRSNRVQWVNDPARSASVHKPMEVQEAKQFASRFAGSILAARQRRNQPTPTRAQAESFDFGANAPPTGQPAPQQAAPLPAAPPAPPPPEAQQPSPAAKY